MTPADEATRAGGGQVGPPATGGVLGAWWDRRVDDDLLRRVRDAAFLEAAAQLLIASGCPAGLAAGYSALARGEAGGEEILALQQADAPDCIDATGWPLPAGPPLPLLLAAGGPNANPARPSTDVPTYRVTARFEEGWWFLQSPDLPGFSSQATRLGDVEAMARDLISLLLGVSEDSFDVEIQQL